MGGEEGAGGGEGGAGGDEEETAGAQVSTNPPFPLPSPAHKKGASQHSPRAPFVRRSVCHCRLLWQAGGPGACVTSVHPREVPSLLHETVSPRNFVETVKLQLGQKPAIPCEECPGSIKLVPPFVSVLFSSP